MSYGHKRRGARVDKKKIRDKIRLSIKTQGHLYTFSHKTTHKLFYKMILQKKTKQNKIIKLALARVH